MIDEPSKDVHQPNNWAKKIDVAKTKRFNWVLQRKPF
jgi:hypothetical protein